MTLAGNVLIMVGVGLLILAAVGLLRFPDVFSRMHAGTKAASLGLACVLSGAALRLPDALTVTKLLLAVVFQFVTAPIAAHVIGRAAHRSGVPLWEGTVIDEFPDEHGAQRPVSRRRDEG